MSGVSIETSGGPWNGTVGSFGVLSKGAGARIDVAAIPIATLGQFAEGLRGELGATINTTGSQISTSGEKAHGAAVYNGSTLNMTGGSIATTGLEAHGIQER